jgi:SAM-dependent methyltransferase
MTRRLTIPWHKAVSWWFERSLGIETRGMVEPPTAEGVHYTPLPYPMIFRMFEQLALDRDDVFVDIGCGKGRVVCCTCRLPIRKVVGIEMNGTLLDKTRDNLNRLRGKQAPVVLVERSAEDYDYADATIAYLYNPFNERITQLVVDRLFESYTSRTRRMQVVYANPVHEHTLRKHDWLEKHTEWPASAFPVFAYAVSFWRTREGRSAGD